MKKTPAVYNHTSLFSKYKMTSRPLFLSLSLSLSHIHSLTLCRTSSFRPTDIMQRSFQYAWSGSLLFFCSLVLTDAIHSDQLVCKVWSRLIRRRFRLVPAIHESRRNLSGFRYLFDSLVSVFFLPRFFFILSFYFALFE